jgi:hypothetical protein
VCRRSVMKGFRRRRPLYLSPSVSSDYDRRNDFDELASRNQLSRGRCTSRLVQSIAKLNCGASTPKAETLMSQSDFTFEHLETDDHYLDQPMIDPVSVYPSFVASAPGASVHNVRTRSRRREDDSSDDALTAPRRFVTPSKLRSEYMFRDRSSKIKSAFIGCTGNAVLGDGILPEKYSIQAYDNLYPLDIPECVVIRSIVADGEIDSSCAASSNFPNIPCSLAVSPYHELEETLVAERLELNTLSQHHSSEHMEREEKWDEASLRNSDPDHSQFGKPLKMYCENAHTTFTENSGPEFNHGNRRLPSALIQINDVAQYSQAPPVVSEYDWVSQKTDDATRTFFLASSSQETPKVSSLSKKLKSHQRNISLQSSDTSFGTTKSGATLSTSHSTSTGLSRSSRKTQALIERFERHITAQKALERLQAQNIVQ